MGMEEKTATHTSLFALSMSDLSLSAHSLVLNQRRKLTVHNSQLVYQQNFD